MEVRCTSTGAANLDPMDRNKAVWIYSAIPPMGPQEVFITNTLLENFLFIRYWWAEHPRSDLQDLRPHHRSSPNWFR